MLSCVRSTDYRLIIYKTYRFVMCYTIAQTIYFFQLIKYERLIVLYVWRTGGF